MAEPKYFLPAAFARLLRPLVEVGGAEPVEVGGGLLLVLAGGGGGAAAPFEVDEYYAAVQRSGRTNR